MQADRQSAKQKANQLKEITMLSHTLSETINRGANRSRLTHSLVLAAGIAAASFGAVPAQAQFHYPMHIGVRCQSDFQNSWNPTINMYPMCNNFINDMRGTDTVDFYFNLHGANVAFTSGNGAETCKACGGADSVDFLLIATHGGIANNDPNYAAYAMWDKDSFAWTNDMRLGASGQQLKIFATYACDTFKTSDGHFWGRWKSAYSGGLKIGLGGHDLLYDGNSQKGTEFADRIKDGQPVGLSWLEAVWYGDNANHPSVANTGVNSTDCWNRQGSNLLGVEYLPVLRDSKIGYICYSGWNGK
jgi:hypothetical protein